MIKSGGRFASQYDLLRQVARTGQEIIQKTKLPLAKKGRLEQRSRLEDPEPGVLTGPDPGGFCTWTAGLTDFDQAGKTTFRFLRGHRKPGGGGHGTMCRPMSRSPKLRDRLEEEDPFSTGGGPGTAPPTSGPHCGRFPGHTAGDAANKAGRPHRLGGIDHRGNRGGQGAGGPGDSPPESAQRGALHTNQHRALVRGPHRQRNSSGMKKGAFTGAYRAHRGPASNWPTGAPLFLDDVGQPVPGHPGPTLAGFAGKGVRAGGRQAAPSDRIFRLITATNQNLDETGPGQPLPLGFCITA